MKELLMLKTKQTKNKTETYSFYFFLPLSKTKGVGSAVTVSQQGFLNVIFHFFFTLLSWLLFPLTLNEASTN